MKRFLLAAGSGFAMVAGAAATAESFSALGEQALAEMGAEVVECANARTESVCGAVPGNFSVVEAAFEESETLAALEPFEEWHDDHGMMMRRYTWADAPDGEQEILVIFNANNPAMTSSSSPSTERAPSRRDHPSGWSRRPLGSAVARRSRPPRCTKSGAAHTASR